MPGSIISQTGVLLKRYYYQDIRRDKWILIRELIFPAMIGFLFFAGSKFLL